MQKKYLFIDRDGTIIVEPEDKQIDSLTKLALLPEVIPALLQLQAAGYHLVMVSNQDGLGTASFPLADFEQPQQKLLQLLASQGIHFDDVLICPHTPEDRCDCRKPKVGLLLEYLRRQCIDREHSVVIGDRETDVQLAENLGIRGIRIDPSNPQWLRLAENLIQAPRTARITRTTNETDITAELSLDRPGEIHCQTGIGFLDHMIEQLAKHGQFSLNLVVEGDLHIDDHHTVEDCAIVLGQAYRAALGDKRGIGRYGFVLPMDESQAQAALDLSGRAFFQFKGHFKREQVGALSTELVTHFFHSFAHAMEATLHLTVQGENDHHQIEACFKAVARCLRQASQRQGHDLPSTKGML